MCTVSCGGQSTTFADFVTDVFVHICIVGGGGIAPMSGAKRAPLILANIELCGSIWRSNDTHLLFLRVLL